MRRTGIVAMFAVAATFIVPLAASATGPAPYIPHNILIGSPGPVQLAAAGIQVPQEVRDRIPSGV